MSSLLQKSYEDVCRELAKVKRDLAEAREQLRVCQGLSRQQGQYTQNAVAECLRLRKIISGCGRCATMHNAATVGEVTP